jgi:hypothetical protein
VYTLQLFLRKFFIFSTKKFLDLNFVFFLKYSPAIYHFYEHVADQVIWEQPVRKILKYKKPKQLNSNNYIFIREETYEIKPVKGE